MMAVLFSRQRSDQQPVRVVGVERAIALMPQRSKWALTAAACSGSMLLFSSPPKATLLGALAPAIQDLGDMSDAVGPLGQAQHELEVLHVIEGRIEPTYRFGERARTTRKCPTHPPRNNSGDQSGL